MLVQLNVSENGCVLKIDSAQCLPFDESTEDAVFGTFESVSLWPNCFDVIRFSFAMRFYKFRANTNV